MNKKSLTIFFIFTFFIFNLSFISAITWNRPTIIEMNLNVNSSKFWDNLDTPADIFLSDLADANVPSPSANDVFTFSGGTWVDEQLTEDSPYLSWAALLLSFSEVKLNATIKDLIKPIEHNATSIELLSGTLDDGNLASILVARDGNTYNITEATGVNPLVVIINYTNVENFNTIQIRQLYQPGSSHEIAIGLFECGVGGYEEEYTPNIIEEDEFAFLLRTVVDSGTHICGVNQDVSLRLRHINVGNPSHEFKIDSAHLVQGASTTSPTDPHPV